MFSTLVFCLESLQRCLEQQKTIALNVVPRPCCQFSSQLPRVILSRDHSLSFCLGHQRSLSGGSCQHWSILWCFLLKTLNLYSPSQSSEIKKKKPQSKNCDLSLHKQGFPQPTLVQEKCHAVHTKKLNDRPHYPSNISHYHLIHPAFIHDSFADTRGEVLLLHLFVSP